MIAAFVSAIADMRRPSILGLLGFGAGIAVCLLVIVVGLVSWLVSQFTFFSFGWLDTLFDGAAIIGVALLAIFLLPAVIGAVGGLMLDWVAAIVERANYPSLPPGRKQPFSEAIVQAVRFLLISVVVNLVALTALLVPGLHLVVWLSVNAYLLSREYFDLISARWMEPKPARVLRRSNRGGLFLAGLVLAALTLVPFVNLLVPVLGTAFMVHLFHRTMR
ncbi:MAG: EI24 domain-containing protein [Pseudomonadota bacterium]